MFKDGLLKGKRILITGGGTGLGKEIAERYLQLGAEVVVWPEAGTYPYRLPRPLPDDDQLGPEPEAVRQERQAEDDRAGQEEARDVPLHHVDVVQVLDEQR